jgi:hypothetical protein
LSVYVDKLAYYGRWKYGRSCHMVADTIQELHAMAERIGHRREWFQDTPPASVPHYDLSGPRRILAIKLGAIEVDRRKLVALIRAYRTRSLGNSPSPESEATPAPSCTPLNEDARAPDEPDSRRTSGSSRDRTRKRRARSKRP